MSPSLYSNGFTRPLARHVCARCTSSPSSLRPHFRLFSTTQPIRSTPATPPASGYAPLPSRSLISLTGADAPKFLHGLVTSSVAPPTPSTPGFYTAFLTAQGRVLHDVFIYPSPSPDSPGFILELDALHAPDLLKHLKRHKLRSKVALRALDAGERTAYALWRPDDRWTPHALGGGGGEPAPCPEGVLQLVDHRAPGLGRRVLVAAGAETGALFDGLEEASAEQYRVRRYLRGVPEGQGEIPRESSFPMNVNLDTMGAVDFRKGCYVGQELTIRTHHTGVVRRRVLPVVLYGADKAAPGGLGYDAAWDGGVPGVDAEIRIDGKRGKPGKWIAGVGNVGLAMVRLEMMTDLAVTNEPNAFNENDKFVVDAEGGTQLGVKAFVPDWLRGKIRAPKTQKRVD